MFEAAILNAIRQHAVREYPKECCGVVIDGVGYVKCVNAHPDPNSNFKISIQEWAKVTNMGDVLAVIHSHPDGPDCPTESDMKGQENTNVPWGIISTDGNSSLPVFFFGDQVPIPPLVGRGFRHGVTDCCSIIRDWYRQELGITLPIGARDWEWWLPWVWKGGERVQAIDVSGNTAEWEYEGKVYRIKVESFKDEIEHQGFTIQPPKDLYTDNFKPAGFRVIGVEEVKYGDVFLASIRSDVPNHGGVYVGNGAVIHHLTSKDAVDLTKLSLREPINRWQGFITHWLRHEDNDDA